MQAYEYGKMLRMIEAGKLQPQKLIGERIPLEDAAAEMMAMDSFAATGITVIDRF